LFHLEEARLTVGGFAQRFLDPGTSLGEVLFGLIMTLTFTLGAGLMIEEEGREGARLLLIALIGCNIAWGIIDGALHLVGQLFDRGRVRRLGQAVRQASHERAATALVASEFDELLSGVTTASEREDLYRRVADNVRSKSAAPNQLTRADVLGAVASFWLVFLASFPAAIPFLLIDDARLALRVSNGVLLTLLFVTGYWWARYTLGKPWIVGLCFLIAGIVLVGVAIALGG
jgi:VIT family